MTWLTYLHTYICQLHNYIKRPGRLAGIARSNALCSTAMRGICSSSEEEDIRTSRACVSAAAVLVHVQYICLLRAILLTNNVSHAALASWYFTTAFFSVYRKQKGRQSNVLYNEVAKTTTKTPHAGKYARRAHPCHRLGGGQRAVEVAR